jgi:hypothetical protein
MDDNARKDNPPPDFNKLDLSQLQGFSFGTQWTQEKPSAPERRERGEPGERPRREDRRDAGPDRRDRRAFRRPAGVPNQGGAGAAPAGGAGHERRDFPGDRRPRQEGGDFRGGPRRDGPGGERGPRPQGFGRGQHERGPYESPYYTVTFYPEDSSFGTLVQTIRKSCRTVELFEIARTVVAKPDRFVVVMAHKSAGGTGAPGAAPAGAAAVKPARPVFHTSVPDGIPFETDEAAVSHVLSRHLDKFFDTAEVEVDPPKGNFQVINRCGVTGELLGPPNYHRYNQIVQQHYSAKAARMPFEGFRSRIETVRDPEVVNQWLAKMKKATRYTWKLGQTGQNGRAADPAEAAAESGAAEAEPAPAAPPATPVFDTLEDARIYLLTHARDKVVRTAENARFHGKLLETIPPGEIRRAVEGALERQRKFPLDTANALRGRLRREHFTIFKKGSKGVSYVCAVKRKFRTPGQTFADSIGALITFVEQNPMIRASELPGKFLGIAPLPPPKPVEAPAAAVEGAGGVEPPKAGPELSVEDRARLARMQADLVWLVREGYVTEFIDGRLFAPPPMVEARKKEVESEEHDPENFPEPPPAESTPAPVAGSPAADAAPVEPAPAATEAQPPAADAPPPGPDAPAAEHDAPAAEQDVPAAEQDAPAEEQDAAPAEHDAPAAEPDAAAAEQDVPAAEQDAPAAEQDAPPAEQDAAAAEQDAAATEQDAAATHASEAPEPYPAAEDTSAAEAPVEQPVPSAPADTPPSDTPAPVPPEGEPKPSGT